MNSKIKLTAKLFAPLALVCAALITGCAGTKPGAIKMTPQFAGSLASIGVHYGTRNISTNTRAELVFLSQTLCNTANGTNIAPIDFYQSVNPANFSEVTLGILNGVQLIYAGVAATADTNSYTLQDYAREIWCVGLPSGLGMVASPTAARIRSQPIQPGALPPVFAKPLVDPKFPLWTK